MSVENKALKCNHAQNIMLKLCLQMDFTRESKKVANINVWK